MKNPHECFDKAAMDAANCLELPSATTPTLTNPIHPIFRASNFPRSSRLSGGKRLIGGRKIAPSVYATISPALRLASNFITQPAGLLWWSKLLLGTVQSVPGEDREVLVDVPPTFGLGKMKLTEHAEHVSFRWRDQTDCYASTFREPSNPSDSIIYLETKMKTFAEGEYHASSTSQQLRFQFNLALNLCHELAHSVMYRRQIRREPFFDLAEPEAELGASWEYSIFGGKIQPINGSPTARDGLMWYPWQSPNANKAAMQRNDRRFVAVTMGWVVSQFDVDSWKKVRPQMTVPACTAVVPYRDDFKPQLAKP